LPNIRWVFKLNCRRTRGGAATSINHPIKAAWLLFLIKKSKNIVTPFLWFNESVNEILK
jgi:hypothetical protein